MERSLNSVFRALERSFEKNECEILIGLNGRDDASKVILERIQAANSSWTVTVIPFESPLAPGACRNHLIPGAAGEWIYFLDDDAYVEEDFFSRWESCGLRGNCAAVGGPNLNPPESNIFQRAASRALACPFATYFSSARYRQEGPARLCDEEALILCHLFVRKEALAAEPFLKALICAEENWMLQNLKMNEQLLGYDPDLFVWHERRPDLPSFFKQVIKYGYGRGQIFRRRRKGAHVLHLVPTLCLIYTAALMVAAALGFSLPFWLFLPFLVYGILCVYFAVRFSGKKEKSWGQALLLAALFPVIHVGYGWGLLRGFLSFS